MPISLRRKSDASTRSVFKRPGSAASVTKEPRVSSDASPAPQGRQLGVPLAPLSEATSRVSPTASPNRPPPSAFRRVNPGAFSPSAKGKEREPPMTLQRPGRAGWIMDPLEARRGADVWLASSRVVLILGEPSLAALSPLLYSSAFADTLVLVGSMAPIPEIQALSSPSHLLNTNDGRTIYPTVQNFQPSAKALNDAIHPITALLQQGVALAEAHRRESTEELTRPPSFGPRSRRGSQTSLRSGTMTPPGTPPRRGKLFRFGSRSPSGSPAGSRNGSSTDLSSMSPGGPGGSRPPSVFEAGSERASPSLKRRVSSIFRTDPIVSDGSPVDAIVNFIPFARNPQDTQAALREMLQSTVTLTTAALPILSTVVSNASINAQLSLSELSPLSLVHIVPVDAPLTLAPVIEKFLLPILPTMANRVRRPLFGVVTGYGAWLSPGADPANDGISGAETLLFGGVRCPMQLTGEGAQPQALLAGWDHCTSSPGMLVEASENTDSPPAFSRRASTLALSELRSSTAGSLVHSARPRTQSIRSSSSQSPPTSPLSPMTPVLPPGAAAPRSTSPTQPKRTPSPKESTVERMRSPSPRAEKNTSRLAEQTKGGASLRGRASGKVFGMRPSSSDIGHADPKPGVMPGQRPHSQGENQEQTSPTESPAQFVSRFDPRWREWEAKAKAKENLRATLSSTHASHNLAAQASSLPPGAGAPNEFGAQERKSLGPSGLRNAVTMPRMQPSPPTPELDPSSTSSCSSSSVIETNWSEERSGASSGSSKRSSAAGGPTPLTNTKPVVGSISRKPFGFGSIFKRRTVRA